MAVDRSDVIRKLEMEVGADGDDGGRTDVLSIEEARREIKKIRCSRRSIPSTPASEKGEIKHTRTDISTRNYKLNPPKAINKKMHATEREHVEILETGGGVKVVLDTGTYEMLRLASEKYYTENDEGNRKCKIVQIKDKAGNQVETQYKLSIGSASMYTLNLYHTTSSCLANGKKVNSFKDKDFP